MATTTGLVAVSGCLFGRDSPDAGTLVLDNDHDQSHTMVVEVTKTSNNRDDVRDEGTPAAKQTPIWNRTSEFTVASQEKRRVQNFINEPGAFYIEARLDDDEVKSMWYGLFRNEKGNLGINAIFINIQSHGTWTFFQAHSD